MSHTYTRVNFGSMQQAHAELLQSYRALTDELHELEQSVEQGLSEWGGEARAAYEDARKRWAHYATDMGEVLKQMGIAVGGAHDGYSATERRNQGIWT